MKSGQTAVVTRPGPASDQVKPEPPRRVCPCPGFQYEYAHCITSAYLQRWRDRCGNLTRPDPQHRRRPPRASTLIDRLDPPNRYYDVISKKAGILLCND